MLTLRGHQGAVYALAFAADGRTLVSGGKDGTVRLWDLSAGRARAELRGHEGSVYTLALHRDGRLLASGGADRDPRVWDAETGTLREVLPRLIAPVTGLAWLPRRHTLAIATGERMHPGRVGEVKLRQTSGDATSLHTLHTEAQGVWALAASPDGSALAWSGGARWVAHRPLTAQQPKLLRQPTGASALAFAPDGRVLAAAADRVIRLWDPARGREAALLEGHKGVVGALAFGPDGRTLYSGGRDKAVRVWDVFGPPRPVAVFDWSVGGVYSVAVAADGLRAAAGGDSGVIAVWDLD